MKNRDNLLIIFAKNPRSTGVKTRLGEDLGERNAGMLYEHLLLELIQSHAQGSHESARCYHVKIYVDGSKEYFHDLADEKFIVEQKGENLGDRMFNAFDAELDNYDSVILIGSDIPEVDPEFIKAAFEMFADNKGVDGVIGPAKDGGYYLVGLNERHDLFKDMKWGESTVFSDTMALAQEMRLNLMELEEKRDIDKAEDLDHFEELAKWLTDRSKKP